jgi:cytochrome c oxidase subunit I+III
VVCIIAWLWQTDRLPAGGAQVAEAVRLPIGATRSMSHSWWATVVLLVVDFTVLASMAFGHIHLSMLLAVCPPPGSALPPASQVMLATAGFAASGALLWWCGRGLASSELPRLRLLSLAVATAALIASFVFLLNAMLEAGLSPTSNGWSATIASLLSYLGFHVVLMILAAGYLGARIWHGLVTARQRATFDNIALLWWGSCAQGAIVALLPHIVTAFMQ